MACFITPLITGLLIRLFKKLWIKESKIKLDMLELMLIGGSVILMIEHVWRGEITPYPPFLTAMASAGDTSMLIREISFVGGLMTLAVSSLWAALVVVSERYKVRFNAIRHSITTLRNY